MYDSQDLVKLSYLSPPKDETAEMQAVRTLSPKQVVKKLEPLVRIPFCNYTIVDLTKT